MEMLTVFCQSEKYHSLIAGTLAQTSASTVQIISTTLDDSHFLNLLIKL